MNSQRDREPRKLQARISWLIWVYFWLLIFEGALRRWVFPGLSTPLLLIRDPIALAIVILALQAGLLIRAPMLWSAVTLGIVSFVATMLFGHGNLFVAAFGLRILLLHVPLIFIIGRTWTRLDVLKLGKVVCFVTIPMALLAGAQFHLPQSHWINTGIGGEGTAGFGATAERFRPPGTFSFTLGLVQFFSITGAFLMSYSSSEKRDRLSLWPFSALALTAAVPLSMSRGLLFQLLLSGGMLALMSVSTPRRALRVLAGGAIIGCIALLAMAVPGSRDAMDAFAERWTAANEVEGGVKGVFVDRFLGGLWTAFTNAGDMPILGFGLGLGTNAAAGMQTGERAFLLAEGEWLRLVGEMGPVLGLGLIFVRSLIAIGIIQMAWRSARQGDFLPLLLASVGALWVAQGNWGQPTSLGFSVLTGGISLASNRRVMSIEVRKSSQAGLRSTLHH